VLSPGMSFEGAMVALKELPPTIWWLSEKNSALAGKHCMQADDTYTCGDGTCPGVTRGSSRSTTSWEHWKRMRAVMGLAKTRIANLVEVFHFIAECCGGFPKIEKT